MGAIPETLYARDGDRYLAYQVVGDHGPALMFVPPTNFPIDLLWDEPTRRRSHAAPVIFQPPHPDRPPRRG
jgi:hypothetical protein